MERHGTSRRTRLVALGSIALATLLSGCGPSAGSPSAPTGTVRPGGALVAESTPTATSVVPTASPTATATATANPDAFTTPGEISGWTHFTYRPVPKGDPAMMLTGQYGVDDLIRWSGGYAAIGRTQDGSPVIVTSSDGERWQAIRSFSTGFLAAGPNGLVVINHTATAVEVWMSADGTNWHNAGAPSGLVAFGGIVGNGTGFVAAATTTKGPSGFYFSKNAISWRELSIDVVTGRDDVGLWSNGSRFFLMIGDSKTGRGSLYRSDDGTVWTRTNWNGFCEGCTANLLFGDAGIVSFSTRGIGTGPALAMEVSRDGGRTWTADPNFGPLGTSGCPDDCVSAGLIGSNGTTFVAVSDDGKVQLSVDGVSWRDAGEAPGWNAGIILTVLPRGFVVPGSWGVCDDLGTCMPFQYGAAG